MRKRYAQALDLSPGFSDLTPLPEDNFKCHNQILNLNERR